MGTQVERTSFDAVVAQLDLTNGSPTLLAFAGTLSRQRMPLRA